VFDIGHQAVGFEDIPTSLQQRVDAGIPIFKLQEVAAMHIPVVTQAAVDALAQFAKTVYLSQTVQKKDGRITKYDAESAPPPGINTGSGMATTLPTTARAPA